MPPINAFTIKKQLVLTVTLSFCFAISLIGQQTKIDGLTMVAPPKAFTEDPFGPMKAVAADWVCFVPYGFTMQGKTSVIFDTDRQWWGEKTEGVKVSILDAQKSGMKVMLKPQIYIPGGWPGGLDFKHEQDWQKWELGYAEFILHWARLAAEHDVEMLCIGTEFKISTINRPDYWRQLIRQIRQIYCGELVYSANWDEYDKVTFWEDLDYVGVSSYFPLDQDKTPSMSNLLAAWKPIKKSMAAFSEKVGRPILFTEYGYLSVNGCCGKTWELESEISSLDVNEQCQSIALDALCSAFGQEDWWAGGFLWKWFPNGQGHEGYEPKDYTPQNKMASETLKKHYGKW